MAMNIWKQSLDAFIMALNGIIIYIGYRFYKTKQMSLVLFSSLITLVIFVINRVISLINRIGDLPYILGGIAVSEQVTIMPFQNPSTQVSGRKKFSAPANIRIQNLSYSYPNAATPILKGISLDIPYGTNHLIHGESGSGKTTLCRCLMGYYSLTKPEMITIDNIPIQDIDKKFLRTHLTFMTQNGFLFDWTVQDNISKDPNVIEKLKRMSIYPKIEPFMTRRCGKLGNQLSGGQRQIVLLLRTFFRPSMLVILDEPTSNLDPKTRDIVITIIQEMCRTKTVLCITHDPKLMPYFDNVYDMVDGVLKKKKTSPNYTNASTHVIF
jgi:ATP-binding cassette subfamily C protein